MTLMKEALSKEDYDRMEKGLPRLKPKKIVVPDPIPPVVDNEIAMNHILDGYEVSLAEAKKNIKRNEDGVMFIGFDVVIDLFPARKKKPGRPKESGKKLEPITLEGWMLEGKFLEFVRTYRKQIDQQVIHW